GRRQIASHRRAHHVHRTSTVGSINARITALPPASLAERPRSLQFLDLDKAGSLQLPLQGGMRPKTPLLKPPAPSPRHHAPITQHHEATHHPTEMREMRNAFLRTGDAEVELEDSVKHHEYARRHGNWWKQQHDAIVREVHGIGE